MRVLIEAPNAHAELEGMLDALDRALREHAIPASMRGELRLIAEEVLCNTMDHGVVAPCDAPEPHCVSIAVEQRADCLHVEFRDRCGPFDPLAHPPPALDDDILDRPIGGLGLYLVRELGDSVSYVREEPHNVLRVVLRIPTEGEP